MGADIVGSVPCGITDVLELVAQLPGTQHADHDRYLKLSVISTTFGYVWPATVTVGLKQTIADQLGLVAERPEVFERQFTAHGFGWVVVHLEGVERDELAELVLDAWRLSAPAHLADDRADRLPV